MISVTCMAPQRSKGNYEFKTYVVFVQWLIGERLVGSISKPLTALAERGTWSARTGRHRLEITGPSIGYAAKELGRCMGAIKTRGGDDVYSEHPQVALDFAKQLDETAA